MTADMPPIVAAIVIVMGGKWTTQCEASDIFEGIYGVSNNIKSLSSLLCIYLNKSETIKMY
jgi:hypothetical protein